MFEPYNLGALIGPEQRDDRVALIDVHGADVQGIEATHWTRAALEDAADAFARALLARGYSRGERVAILSANRVEYLIAYLGTMRAGLVSVPVNYRLPPETIAYVLADAEVRLVVIDDSRSRHCPTEFDTIALDPQTARTRTSAIEFDDFLAEFLGQAPFDPMRPDGDEVAMFLYTSGSTGMPKGVPLTHAGHLWVISKRYQPGVDYERERMLVAAPLYHMNGLAITKFALACGATEILLPQFQAQSYIRAIEAHRCTWLTSVPTMMALVVQQRELLSHTDLSSVRSVRMGSAPVTTKLIDQIREVFPNAAIQIGYGTTEAGPVAFGPHPEGLTPPPLALGYPHPEVKLRLTNGGDRDAEQGVLEMTCPALMPGYHNLPEKTMSVMTEDGYYVTGDVMRRDADGFYYFVGRDDDMFVCNGENVFPEEVERLLERHRDVIQACVVPVEDEVRGQMPVAFVVAADDGCDDHEALAATLKAYTIEQGPAYQHPRRIFFESSLPLAGTNKIDRKVLTAKAMTLVSST